MLQGYYGLPGYQGLPGYKGAKVIYILTFEFNFKYATLGKMLQICAIRNKGIIYASSNINNVHFIITFIL